MRFILFFIIITAFLTGHTTLAWILIGTVVLGIFLLRFDKPQGPRLRKFRNIPYTIHSDRESFHEEFIGYANNGGGVHACELDENGRVIGAYVTFTGSQLTDNKRLIRSGQVTRNNKARQTALVPGMDIAKRELTIIGDKPYFHYHRTHLIPFRFCLNDGEFANMMFTGTARLNAGHIPQNGYIPSDEEHAKNVEHIINITRTDPSYFTHADTTYSLDDFERAADQLVYDSAESYKHTFKYGVECLYQLPTVIPTHILVTFMDMTQRQVLFAAVLKNTL